MTRRGRRNGALTAALMSVKVVTLACDPRPQPLDVVGVYVPTDSCGAGGYELGIGEGFDVTPLPGWEGSCLELVREMAEGLHGRCVGPDGPSEWVPAVYGSADCG